MNPELSKISDARQIAVNFLNTLPAPGNFSFVILDEYTIERPACFVFFYESSRFLETGSFEDRLAGNAPLLVDRKTMKVHSLGTAHPVEHYIENFEAASQLKNSLAIVTIEPVMLDPARPSRITANAVREQLVAGVEQANRELGINYRVARIQFFLDDTPSDNIHRAMARSIVRRVHE